MFIQIIMKAFKYVPHCKVLNDEQFCMCSWNYECQQRIYFLNIQGGKKLNVYTGEANRPPLCIEPYSTRGIYSFVMNWQWKPILLCVLNFHEQFSLVAFLYCLRGLQGLLGKVIFIFKFWEYVGCPMHLLLAIINLLLL